MGNQADYCSNWMSIAAKSERLARVISGLFVGNAQSLRDMIKSAENQTLRWSQLNLTSDAADRSKC